MSSKPEQVLVIEPPNELVFRGPFTGAPTASYMKLTNPTLTEKIYFKIKTTAPKNYCVRPNCGIIKPKQICEIAICLQPSEYDPKKKNKHKFMVQSIVAPNTEPDEDPSEIWRDVQPHQLIDTKLKCVFENLDSTTTTNTMANTTTSKPDSNSADDKTKNNEEALKSPLKVDVEAKAKLFKLSHEINMLRLEGSKLKQENLILKEEIMEWKNPTLGKDVSLTSISGLIAYLSHKLRMSTTSMIVAVAMVVFGYYLGKLI